MTVSTDNNKNRYEGNGVTDTFAFSGRVFSASDIVADIITRATDTLVETLTNGSGITVTLTGDESASVVTDAGKIPSGTQDILVRRALPRTQTVDLPTGTRFPAKSVENALDKNVATLQDLAEEVSRAVVVPTTSEDTPPTIGALTASTILQVDSTGAILESSTLSSSDLAALNAIAADITTVAGISANVTTVAGISANVTTVAGISSNVTTVAGISANVTTVAGISGDVTTVASNDANITTVATNIAGVNSFAERYRVVSSDPVSDNDEGDLIYNTTSNTLKYYNGASFDAVTPFQSSSITGQTEAVIGTDDYLVYSDTGDSGNLKKDTVRGVLETVTSLTSVTAAATDELLINDASDTGAAKKVTAQSIADLAGGGAWEFISSQTASSDSSLDFTGFRNDTDYDNYVFVITDILPASDGNVFQLRTSTNGGSSYDSGASDYRFSMVDGNDGSTGSAPLDSSNGAAQNYIKLIDNVSNTAGETISGYVELYSPASTSYSKILHRMCNNQNTNSAFKFTYGGGNRDSAADVDAIRFFMQTGNIASGTIALYGIKKA